MLFADVSGSGQCLPEAPPHTKSLVSQALTGLFSCPGSALGVHMPRRATRLFRKSTGVYWLRVVLPRSAFSLAFESPSTASSSVQASSPPESAPKSRPELRRSLRTVCPRRASTLASIVNAALALSPPSRWESVVSRLLGDFASGWTLPGGLTVTDDADQARLLAFLAEKPAFEAAAIDAIRQSGAPAPSSIAAALEAVRSSDVQPLGETPKNPLRLDAALEYFQTSSASLGLTIRNARDIGITVNLLIKYFCPDPSDTRPYVHHIGSNHLFDFLKSLSSRAGRSDKSKASDQNAEIEGLAPATLLKKLSDLSTFFRIMCGEAQACVSNPMDGLKSYRASLKKQDSRRDASYAPFDDDSLKTLFSPEVYLLATREPDYFYPPLISAVTGMRLSEIVCRTIDEVLNSDGVWHFRIYDGKNENSIRCVPIPQCIIDLGFLDYVARVRELGGVHLWPHRNFDTKTARENPTKRQQENFAELMDRVGLTDPSLVFHSFRHTVVSALLDDPLTGLHMSMQLCGHEVQEEAIKRGLMSDKAKGTVHLKNYAHADKKRLGKSNPLLDMKIALERAVQLPIDLEKLKIAASIVNEHFTKTADGFSAGWAPQSERKAREIRARFL